MFVEANIVELKKRRLRAGLSMKGLSKKANLPENAVLRIEKGESIRTNHLRAKEIATALGCNVEEIFTPIDTDNKGA